MIINLKDELINASGLDTDRRWSRWCKAVDSVDTSKTNGYCFIGAFVANGDIEVILDGKPKLFLVCTETGSNKYRTKNYAIVKMHADGTLEAVGIEDDDSTRGWALRMRDKVHALLQETAGEEVDPLADFSTDMLIKSLKMRGIEVLES